MTKELMKQEQDDSVSYIQKMIEALYENSDPVSVEAAELLERIIAKQNQGEQLARLGWQEIDCPICGGGARAFPKQEQGEPVECKRCGNSGVIDDGEIDCYEDGTPFENCPIKCVKDCPDCTTPQTKEWVGLTSAELNVISDRMRTWNSFQITDVYFAIEAKLKENNGH